MRRAFERECLQYGNEFTELPVPAIEGRSKLLAAWRNRHFLAQIYREASGSLRITVQRCSINKDGSWVDGITWDELMKVKSGIGFGDRWAVEVYPPPSEVVNVANMRHLFLLSEPPPYAWRKTGV